MNLQRDFDYRDWGIVPVNPICFNNNSTDISKLPAALFASLNEKWNNGQFLTNDELHILGRYLGSNLYEKLKTSK